MKAALLLFVVVLGLASAYQCPKGFCSKVDCSGEPTKETCKGHLVENSSLCGCCSTCVIRIPYGGECTDASDLPTKAPFEVKVCPSLSTCFNNRCVALPR